MDITSSGNKRLLWTALLSLFASVYCNAANLVANSSFELGAARGWTYWKEKDQEGSPLTLKSQIVGSAAHGSKCARITTSYSLHSKPIYLTAGVTYTLSYWAKSSPNGNTFVARVSQMGDINTGPTHSTVPPTSWTRFSHIIVPAVNYWHFVNFHHFQDGLTVDVDGVQLEVGGTASAWTPHSTVEAGLECTNAYNVIFGNQPRHIQLSIWNEGATTTNRAFYSIYDLWNRTKATGTVLNVVAPGLTTTNISLVLTGFNRITSRLPTSDTWDELTANVLPFNAHPTIARTNGYFGATCNYDSNQIANLRKVGYTWVRIFSPSFLFRWSHIEPTQGNFNWYPDAYYNINSTNGLVPVATFHELDRAANPWTTNASGALNVPAFSNLVWQSVNRYKHLIKHWEILNEPQQTGWAWITDANNYASVLGPAARAVKAADPTAKVVGMGGVWEQTWVTTVLNALSTDDRAKVDILSAHFYPTDNYEWDDFNNGHFDARPYNWKAALASTGKELWNTECATWGRGGYLTENAIWGYRWWSSEDWMKPEEMTRSVKSVARLTCEALRNFGNGFQKVFLYDNRNPTEEMMNLTHSTGWELGGGHKPTSIALQIMAHFIDEFTQGFQVVHSSSATPEMYLFYRGPNNTNTMVVWNHDRINRLLTVTNGNFVQYDVMGNVVPRPNPLQVVITGMPQYFVGNGTEQLYNTFVYSTIGSLADTNPPGLSVNIAPTGVWPGGTTLIMWSAVDDIAVNIGTSYESKTNVSFTYKFDNESYGPFSQTNFINANLSAGNHTLWVKARDRLLNTMEVAYVFDPGTASDPPPPGDPPPPQPPLQATVTPSRIKGR